MLLSQISTCDSDWGTELTLYTSRQLVGTSQWESKCSPGECVRCPAGELTRPTADATAASFGTIKLGGGGSDYWLLVAAPLNHIGPLPEGHWQLALTCGAFYTS